MSWCEMNRVDYLLGLARNPRLVGRSKLSWLRPRRRRGKRASPRAASWISRISIFDSWSRRRRVVGKAEWTNGEVNPRFVDTTLKAIERPARELYEDVYCARGDMENRIKAFSGRPFADRTSASTMRDNQLRLWFSSMADVLVCAVRRIGLAHTQFADATCGRIRLKLFEIGALVESSAPAVKFALPSAARAPTNGAGRRLPRSRRSCLPLTRRRHERPSANRSGSPGSVS